MPDLWEMLKKRKPPVYLYGTGDGADKIMERLEGAGIFPSGFFVTDDFARGQTFCGLKVESLSSFLQGLSEKRYARGGTEPVVLVAFASDLVEIDDNVRRLEKAAETYVPHVPLFHGDRETDAGYLRKHKDLADRVRDIWADDLSRKVMDGILGYRASGRADILRSITTGRKDDLRGLFDWSKKGAFVDAGAYDGDTAAEFLELGGDKIERVFAMEPDSKNFARLLERAEKIAPGRIECINAACWKKSDELTLLGRGGRQSHLADGAPPLKVRGKRRDRSEKVRASAIDDIVNGAKVSFMKFDVEGAEKEALWGARHTLAQKDPPQLMAAAYHHDMDIFELPLLIRRIDPRRRLFLRKHPYLCGWELNIFAV